MALVVNTNVASITSQMYVNKTNQSMADTMERLSSGKRINSASDDAAGLAISDRLTAQVRGINQAVRNAQDGQSLIDTTEGAHQEITNILQRMRELAVQSANDTNVSSDRENLKAETNQLIAEINRISSQTTWNSMKVLDGSFVNKQLHIGSEAGQTIDFGVDSSAATAIGAHKALSTVSLNSAATTQKTDTGIVASSSIVVNGYLGSSTITTSAGQSAKSLAQEVNNNTSSTGVSATAVTKAKIGSFSAASSVSFKIQGVEISQVAITDTTDLRGIRDAINAVSGRTGVTASMGSSNAEVLLEDSDGDDIYITNYDTSVNDATMVLTALTKAGAAAGSTANQHTTTFKDTTAPITASYVTGQVEMTSTKAFTVGHASSATDGTTFFASDANSSSLSDIASVDISTSAGADSAITVIDKALQKIADSRATLGAISNRLDNTVSNLSNVAINVESSRSQIEDADFAAESANLAKQQIMLQAGTAMLAQANAAQQNVLSLLS